MSHLILDFETRSKCDLKKAGVWVYSCHPSTEVLCCSMRLDEGPVRTWTPKYTAPSFPEDAVFEAHNAEFERAIWQNVCTPKYGWPKVPDIPKWRCSAARAAALALPRKLEDAGTVLALPHQKNMEGHRLMLKMSKPRKPTKNNPAIWHNDPEDFKKLFEYCEDDVKTEYALSHNIPYLSLDEQKVWELDQRINQRGFAVDLPTIDGTILVLMRKEKRLLEEFSAITHGTVTSPRQVAALMEYLKEEGVVGLYDLTKATVEMFLMRELSPDARRLLEIRQELGKSSTAKFQAMKNMAGSDGRIRGAFMYHGAATGRWAGKGIQPHNMPRKKSPGEECMQILRSGDVELVEAIYGPPSTVASSAVRGMIIANEGKEFVCADYSAIEGRVLAWMAGEDHILEAYRKGLDPYIIAASGILDKPYDKITKEERQLPGKVAELGCGFGGGAAACRKFGAEGTDEELKEKIVTPWRENRPNTVAFWRGIETAAIKTVMTRKPHKYKCASFLVESNFLFMVLPSGRRLGYYRPEIKTEKTPWGADMPRLYFWGVDSVTKKWVKSSTYGGKLTENIVQAASRDILVQGMMNVEAAGYPIVLHVHDEIVAEVKKGTGDLKEFCRLMCELPKWADGLPMKAEGWIGKRYRK